MAKATLMTVTLTNIAAGPRVINAEPVILLQAGATADVVMNDAELKAAKATGWFAMGAKSPPIKKGEAQKGEAKKGEAKKADAQKGEAQD